MSFLDEVDSIESKLGFRRVNPIALIGIGLVALLVVGAKFGVPGALLPLQVLLFRRGLLSRANKRKLLNRSKRKLRYSYMLLALFPSLGWWSLCRELASKTR